MSASASASPAGTSTLTGAAVIALFNKALADTEAAPTVVMKATGIPGGTDGEPVSFDLTVVQKVGCEGTFEQSKTETFQVVLLGGYDWVKASNGFYASVKLTQADIGLIDGRWIKVKSTDAQMANFSQLCDLSSQFGTMKPSGSGWMATPTTYEGRSVYEVIQSGTPGYGYVTNSATPMLLAAGAQSESGGAITLTEYSTPLTITAPSAAESIDGSGLGF